MAEAVQALADAGLNVLAADPGFSDPIDAFEVLWATGAAGSLRGRESDRGLVDPGLADMWDRGPRFPALTTWRPGRSVWIWAWPWDGSTNGTIC